MSNFNKALEFVLRWEGGYVNDPKDPGGETKYGISKRAFPKEDIKNMTKERAAEIYQQHYWIPSGCERMELGMATAVFDSAVNCGVGRAKQWLAKSKDAFDIIKARNDYYDVIIARNKNLLKFRRGWLNRTADLEKFIRSLSRPSQSPSGTQTAGKTSPSK